MILAGSEDDWRTTLQGAILQRVRGAGGTEREDLQDVLRAITRNVRPRELAKPIETRILTRFIRRQTGHASTIRIHFPQPVIRVGTATAKRNVIDNEEQDRG